MADKLGALPDTSGKVIKARKHVRRGQLHKKSTAITGDANKELQVDCIITLIRPPTC